MPALCNRLLMPATHKPSSPGAENDCDPAELELARMFGSASTLLLQQLRRPHMLTCTTSTMLAGHNTKTQAQDPATTCETSAHPVPPAAHAAALYACPRHQTLVCARILSSQPHILRHQHMYTLGIACLCETRQ
jgi:hypothetical protein